jgi:hypothetical protein
MTNPYLSGCLSLLRPADGRHVAGRGHQTRLRGRTGRRTSHGLCSQVRSPAKRLLASAVLTSAVVAVPARRGRSGPFCVLRLSAERRQSCGAHLVRLRGHDSRHVAIRPH